jgi:hypothetical protein
LSSYKKVTRMTRTKLVITLILAAFLVVTVTPRPAFALGECGDCFQPPKEDPPPPPPTSESGPVIDDSHINADVGTPQFLSNNADITITGLPNVPGGGGHGNSTSAADLAGIEPAAGGNDTTSDTPKKKGCWKNMVGTSTVSYTLNTDSSSVLEDEAACK